jgi:enamidase
MLSGGGRLLAQNATQGAAVGSILITNARILDGRGGVIERGSILVRDGKIESLAQGTAANAPNVRVLDAQGRTVMPGFIDAHRHIIGGGTDAAQWLREQAAVRMQEFLDSGFTTVLSAGDPPEILELRRRTQTGAIRGPRIFAAGRVALARAAATPASQSANASAPVRRGDPARFDVSRPPLRLTVAAGAIPPADTIAAVDSVAKAGYDYIKTVITVTPGGPETETLKLVVREGKKHGVPTITHASSVSDALAAVDAGPAVLVHTPFYGRLEEDPAAVDKIAKAGIPMTSTMAIFIPHFDAENKPVFRDRLPFPWNTINSAGQAPVNARLLWEAGISYGYGTDTSWHPRESLADELRSLSLVFSPRDIVAIMTKNAANSALRSSELGTLEPGKFADMVILDGDPLTNITSLLNVVTTIKGGAVVSDKRTPIAPSSR